MIAERFGGSTNIPNYVHEQMFAQLRTGLRTGFPWIGLPMQPSLTVPPRKTRYSEQFYTGQVAPQDSSTPDNSLFGTVLPRTAHSYPLDSSTPDSSLRRTVPPRTARFAGQFHPGQLAPQDSSTPDSSLRRTVPPRTARSTVLPRTSRSSGQFHPGSIPDSSPLKAVLPRTARPQDSSTLDNSLFRTVPPQTTRSSGQFYTGQVAPQDSSTPESSPLRTAQFRTVRSSGHCYPDSSVLRTVLPRTTCSSSCASHLKDSFPKTHAQPFGISCWCSVARCLWVACIQCRVGGPLYVRVYSF